MLTAERLLLASIHDVSPRFEDEVDRLVDLLDPHVGKRIAMLVVPNHWGNAPIVPGSAFASRLRAWAEGGFEMFLHGYFHRDDTKHRSAVARARARHMTAGEGEFLGLSRHIYTRLHHEPFQTDVAQWDFPAGGPLSEANGALPWILFQRDRARFEAEFPNLQIEQIRPMMPFRYLVSGGVSMRSLMPAFTTAWWKRIEKACESHMDRLAMFSLISLRRL